MLPYYVIGVKKMENKICVYAICKNESKFVKKWLNSMQEADYIVVLDTGSTDGTYKMLKEDPRVTKVEKKVIKPWRFDVARNESMKLIPEDANILVCTDFDEVFDAGWANKLRERWDNGYTRANYMYSWSVEEDGSFSNIFAYDKIHNRDYHWHYPVHEVLKKNDDAMKEVVLEFGDEIYLHHYRDITKKRNYLDLLKVSVEENPTDPHPRMLLAREYLLVQDMDKALEEYLEVIKMPLIDNELYKQVLLESLLKIGCIYQAKDNYDEGLWYMQEFIKEDSTYREPYLFMAEMYNDMKMPTLASSCVDAAIRFGTRKFDWVEHTESWLGKPSDIKGVSCFYMKQYREALNFFKEALRYDKNNVRLLRNCLSCYEMMEATNG